MTEFLEFMTSPEVIPSLLRMTLVWLFALSPFILSRFIGMVYKRRRYDVLKNYHIVLMARQLDPEGQYQLPELIYRSHCGEVKGAYDYVNNVVLLTHRKNYDDMLYTLFHEMRHWWQFKSGKAKILGIRKRWWGLGGMDADARWNKKRRWFKWRNFNDYVALPWEKDARTWAYKQAMISRLRASDLKNRAEPLKMRLAKWLRKLFQ